MNRPSEQRSTSFGRIVIALRRRLAETGRGSDCASPTQHMTGWIADASSTLQRRSPKRASHANCRPKSRCCIAPPPRTAAAAAAAAATASFIWRRPSDRIERRIGREHNYSERWVYRTLPPRPDEMDRTTYQTGMIQQQYISCKLVRAS